MLAGNIPGVVEMLLRPANLPLLPSKQTTAYLVLASFAPAVIITMDAHSEGTESVARLLAPKLLGEDPRQLTRIGRLMDGTVRGHGYAKSPIDAAC